MSALLESIALSYAKTLGLKYITDEAREYAAKKLGIDTQKGNPKYAINLGGQNFNLMNMFKNVGLNQGIKGIMGSGSNILGPLSVGAGIMFLANKTNPLNENSYNYNPYLRGELDYAGKAGLLAKNPNSGLLMYGQNSVLRGKNAVTGKGYRTNLENLRDQLQTFKNKGVNKYGITFSPYLDNRLTNTNKEILGLDQDGVNKELAEETKTQNRKTYQAPYQGQVHGNGGSGTNNTQHGSSGMSKSQHSAFRAARGGIASL